MKRVAIASRHGHICCVLLSTDLRVAPAIGTELLEAFGPGFHVELVGEVKALTKPSGWERCFPRERGKRPVSGQAADELIRRGRRFVAGR